MSFLSICLTGIVLYLTSNTFIAAIHWKKRVKLTFQILSRRVGGAGGGGIVEIGAGHLTGHAGQHDRVLAPLQLDDGLFAACALFEHLDHLVVAVIAQLNAVYLKQNIILKQIDASVLVKYLLDLLVVHL